MITAVAASLVVVTSVAVLEVGGSIFVCVFHKLGLETLAPYILAYEQVKKGLDCPIKFSIDLNFVIEVRK